MEYLVECSLGRLHWVQWCMFDYAHTPDALFAVLKALKNMTDKRLTVVVGVRW